MKGLLLLVFYLCIILVAGYIACHCFEYDIQVWGSVISGHAINPLPLWAFLIGGILFSEIAVPIAILTWILVAISLIHPIFL